MTRPMRILLIAHAYLPTVGGTETWADEVARGLVRRGHEVVVSTSDNASPSGMLRPFHRRQATGIEHRDGVEIRRHRMLRSAAIGLDVLRRIEKQARGTTGTLGIVGQYPWIPTAFGEWRDPSFDVLLPTSLPSLCATLPLWMRGRGWIRRPVALHTTAMPHSARFPSPSALRPILGAADILLTDTDAEFAELQAGGWAPDVPHRCVGVGIPDDAFDAGDASRARARFGLSEGRPVLSFVARLTPEKGVLRLLRAADRLAGAGRDFDVVLLGDDASIRTRPEWRRLRARLGDRVRAPGSVSIETVRDVCAASAVMAMPSVADSFGIVYLEAWAQGTPVIGVDVPAMREIIAGGGWLVPADDRDDTALVAALESALDDPDVRRSRGAVGRQRAWDRYRWTHVVDGVEAGLVDVVRGPRR